MSVDVIYHQILYDFYIILKDVIYHRKVIFPADVIYHQILHDLYIAKILKKFENIFVLIK